MRPNRKVIVFFFFFSSFFSLTGKVPDPVFLPTKSQLIPPPVELKIPETPRLQRVPDHISRSFVSIIGVGDIMMGTNYPDESYLPPNDGKHLLVPLHEILQDATLTFGNLEGVLLDGEGTVKKCQNPDLCYAFRSPEKYVSNLTAAGFDVVSLANNHTGDFGMEGRISTARVLKEANLSFAGTLEYPYTILERQGIVFGMAAFSPNTGTLSIHDLENAQKIVRLLEDQTDIVIVSFHGGAEGADHQNVLCETEYYYGENRGNVCKFARAVIDAGADIVFGHGPHVTRSVDLYKDRFIAYSLGNFCTYARFNLRGENGIAPLIKVVTNSSGEFIMAEVTPIRQMGSGEPQIDPNGYAIQSLHRLTQEDFPESFLEITREGVIRKR
ncbi:MAG: CapA family protein [Bacteroidales bacterium]